MNWMQYQIPLDDEKIPSWECLISSKKSTSLNSILTKYYLDKCGIKYKEEVDIFNCPDLLFDYVINYKNMDIILEIDGFHHFTKPGYFSFDKYNFRRKRDCFKTEIALIKGYKVIRVHHRKINELSSIIDSACDYFENEGIFYSACWDDENYDYIKQNFQLITV